MHIFTALTQTQCLQTVELSINCNGNPTLSSISSCTNIHMGDGQTDERQKSKVRRQQKKANRIHCHTLFMSTKFHVNKISCKQVLWLKGVCQSYNSLQNCFMFETFTVYHNHKTFWRWNFTEIHTTYITTSSEDMDSESAVVNSMVTSGKWTSL